MASNNNCIICAVLAQVSKKMLQAWKCDRFVALDWNYTPKTPIVATAREDLRYKKIILPHDFFGSYFASASTAFFRQTTEILFRHDAKDYSKLVKNSRYDNPNHSFSGSDVTNHDRFPGGWTTSTTSCTTGDTSHKILRVGSSSVQQCVSQTILPHPMALTPRICQQFVVSGYFTLVFKRGNYWLYNSMIGCVLWIWSFCLIKTLGIRDRSAGVRQFSFFFTFKRFGYSY